MNKTRALGVQQRKMLSQRLRYLVFATQPHVAKLLQVSVGVKSKPLADAYVSLTRWSSE